MRTESESKRGCKRRSRTCWRKRGWSCRESLPESSKLLHLASTCCVALAVILLLTPAAYHRIVERGETTEHMHQFASAMVLAATIPLALGICGIFSSS